MTEAIATAQQPSQSLIVKMAHQYGLEPNKFYATLEKTILPSGKQATQEQVAAFLVVANHYGLNPFVKEIYAFPSQNGGITPIVSIDGWLSLINRQSQLDGIEFKDHLDDTGKLTAVTAKIYRKDRQYATEVTEYMSECKRNTPTWSQWPSRMLRHKAAIQAARYAFGFAGIYDPDEAERIAENGGNGNGSSIAAKTADRIADLKEKLSPEPADETVPEDNPPPPDFIDADIVDAPDVTVADAKDADGSTSDEPSPAEQTAKAFEIYRNLDDEQKVKANKFLKTKAINELGPDKLADFINLFGASE